MDDQDHLRGSLDSYAQGFSVDMRATFEHFDFAAVVERLQKARLLYLVTEKLTHLDLHLDVVDKAAMGTVFEELIRNVVLGNRLSGNVQAYSERKGLPHASDAWIEYDKPKVGYKIPFNRHFYVFEPPRSLADVDADLKRSADRIRAMIERMSGWAARTHHRGAQMTQLSTTSTADEDRFAEIVQIIELTRRQTVLVVNSALVNLYSQLGAIISRRIAAAEWGDGVMTQFAAHSARTQRVLRGFTRTNPFRTRQFWEAYAHDQKVSALPR